jgi:hypothetical protein
MDNCLAIIISQHFFYDPFLQNFRLFDSWFLFIQCFYIMHASCGKKVILVTSRLVVRTVSEKTRVMVSLVKSMLKSSNSGGVESAVKLETGRAAIKSKTLGAGGLETCWLGAWGWCAVTWSETSNKSRIVILQRHFYWKAWIHVQNFVFCKNAHIRYYSRGSTTWITKCWLSIALYAITKRARWVSISWHMLCTPSATNPLNSEFQVSCQPLPAIRECSMDRYTVIKFHMYVVVER